MRKTAQLKRVSYDEIKDTIADEKHEITFDERISSRVRSAIVRQALKDGLTSRQREYFILRYCDGLNGQKIADMYGVSRSSVCITLGRAKMRISKLLGTQRLREEVINFMINGRGEDR